MQVFPGREPLLHMESRPLEPSLQLRGPRKPAPKQQHPFEECDAQAHPPPVRAKLLHDDATVGSKHTTNLRQHPVHFLDVVERVDHHDPVHGPRADRQRFPDALHCFNRAPRYARLVYHSARWIDHDPATPAAGQCSAHAPRSSTNVQHDVVWSRLKGPGERVPRFERHDTVIDPGQPVEASHGLGNGIWGS